MRRSTGLWISGALYTVIGLCLVHCANPVAPTGGPRDETPPSVVVEESSPNPMVNFNLDEIEITFDEWVALDNPGALMVVSPPIEPPLVPSLTKKTLVIPIDRSLLSDSTTYIINFGESVRDITEKNPAVNLNYVFSTGPFVDSLSFVAEVYSATTGEPIEKAKVILHENLTDTAITELLPSYFAATDSSGRCRLEYLRSDTFRVYAILEQEFGDYRWDEGELFGFASTPVFINKDSLASVRIPVYEPLNALQAITTYREIPQKVLMTRAPLDLSIQGDMRDIALWNVDADTVKFWYTGTDTLEIELLEKGVVFDTIRLEPESESSAVFVELPKKQRHANQPIVFNANNPIESVDKTLTRFTIGDSIVINEYSVDLDTMDPLAIQLNSTFSEKTVYQIQFLPGAIRDVYGGTNDTLIFNPGIDESINFGALNLTITGLDSTIQYVAQLLDAGVVVGERLLNGESSIFFGLEQMPAKPYSVVIIEDLNRNGYWDTGNFETKSQPERIFTSNVEGMRPGWDLDYTITWPSR